MLDGVLRLSRFQTLYPPSLTSAPWFVSNYPPLYYLIHVPFVWLAGPALWQGRLISQVAAVGIATCIGVVVRDVMDDGEAALVAALVFLAIPIVSVWAQYDRVDMVGLALSWAGIWSVTRRDRPRLWLAVACFVASSYTRQTAALPGFVAAYVWLRSVGRGRDANRLVLAVSATGLILFVVLDAVTHGGFLFHVVTGTVGAMSRQQLVSLGGELAALIPILLATAGAAIAMRLWRPLPGWGFLASYVVAAAVIALTVAKAGSYINYFLDLCAACSLAAGASISWLRPRPRAAAVFLLLLVVQIVRMTAPNALYDHLAARLARAPEYAHLMALVRSADGPVLADEPMALLPLSGRTAEFHPFAMTQLSDANLWDDTPFIEQLNQQRFAVALLREPDVQPHVMRTLWDARMASALLQHYECKETVRVDAHAIVVVYGRKGTTSGPDARPSSLGSSEDTPPLRNFQKRTTDRRPDIEKGCTE